MGRGDRIKGDCDKNGNPYSEWSDQYGEFATTYRPRVANGESAEITAEHAGETGESAEIKAESNESRRKSKECVAESNETGNKSRESILSWASNVLPGTIRADARGNMIKILLEIGLHPKTTTDKMKSSVGISESGVHKILVSLKKMGLVSRVGADFGGHWELVGFEP